MINRYSHFLFDADETLFKFDAFAGLQHIFQQFDVYFDMTHFEEYQKLNKPLWVQYQNGDI
ncbi:MAG: pyrimidine 5'-nucleotidase, partial [Marinomonas gallaica]